jgi:para-nitrobenzyl esterase
MLPFAPVVDGTVLPAHPLEAIAAGRGGDIPLMTGYNREEARLFLVAADTIDLIDDATLDASALGYGLTLDHLDVYRANRAGQSPGDILAAMTGDRVFTIPALRVAEARAATGTATTWVYRFDRPRIPENHGLGACHAAELPFVFDTITREELRPLIGDNPSQAIADTTHGIWVSFITHGDPGWAPYTVPGRATGVLTEKLEEVADPAGDEREVWNGIR